MLASTAMRHDCDIVVGTRYASDRSAADGLGGAGAVFVSSYATRLVKDLFPRRLAMVSDPLSGLFAFRRASVDLDRLRPTGFKVLLDILVRNPVARVAEVGLPLRTARGGRFQGFAAPGDHVPAARSQAAHGAAGPAVAGAAGHQGRAGKPGRAVRIVRAGRRDGHRGQHRGALVLLPHPWLEPPARGGTGHPGLHHMELRAGGAVVYRKRAHGTRLGRAVRFFIMNNVLLLARLPVFQILIDRGLPVLIANGITLVLLFVVRFVLSDRAIFAIGQA